MPLCFKAFLWLVIPARRPLRLRGYDMDAAFRSLGQHGCGIHALRSGADGTGVTQVSSRVRMLPPRSNKLSGIARNDMNGRPQRSMRRIRSR